MVFTNGSDGLLYGLTMVLWVLHFAALRAAYNAFFPDASKEGEAILALVAAVLPILEIQFVARLLGRPHFIFDLREWPSRLAFGGLALGFIVACALYFPDLHAEADARRAREEDAHRHVEEMQAQQRAIEEGGKQLAEQFRRLHPAGEAAPPTRP